MSILNPLQVLNVFAPFFRLGLTELQSAENSRRMATIQNFQNYTVFGTLNVFCALDKS